MTVLRSQDNREAAGKFGIDSSLVNHPSRRGVLANAAPQDEDCGSSVLHRLGVALGFRRLGLAGHFIAGAAGRGRLLFLRRFFLFLFRFFLFQPGRGFFCLALCFCLRFFRRFRFLRRLAAGLGDAIRDQSHCLIERHVLRIGSIWNRRIHLVMRDVRAEAAFAQRDRTAEFGMLAENFSGGRAAASLAAARGFFGKQRHRAVDADGEDVVAFFQVGVAVLMLDVGAVAADAGEDRLARLGMLADFARERQERERVFDIDIVELGAFGKARAFRLFLAFLLLAELHVGSEASAAQRNLKTRFGIGAENFRGARAVAVGGKRAGIAAVGIVGAADKAAEFSGFQFQAAGAALRALARIAAVLARRENMRRENF